MKGIDDMDIDGLEKQPEPPKKDKDRKKPEKQEDQKMTDEEKGRVLGMAATVVCIIGIAVFVAMQLIPEKDSGTAQGTEPPSMGSIEASQESPEGAPENAPEFSVEPDGTGDLDPFNRSPGAISDDEGSAVADESHAASGGTRYWVRDRYGTDMFRIVVPAGYEALDYGDAIAIQKSGAGPDVTGDDPMTFYWRKDTETKNLLEHGYYDYLESTGATGYSEYAVRAVGYYMCEDKDGREWPVVTAVFRRTDIEDDSGMSDCEEYRIVVGIPTEDNQYLAGSINSYSFAGLQSMAYPDITALAKALFPMSSDPGFPEGWAWAHGSADAEAYPGSQEGDDSGNPEEQGSYWDEDGQWVEYPDMPQGAVN